MMSLARATGAITSIDLASFELVRNCKDSMLGLLKVRGGRRVREGLAGWGEAGGLAVCSRAGQWGGGQGAVGSGQGRSGLVGSGRTR